MNEISTRQKNIIVLIEEHNIIKGEDLSKLLNISLRTLRNDIAQINSISSIISSCKNGYFLNDNYNNNNLKISNDEINSLLIKLIIDEKKYVIDDISDEFYLSKSSIERRLIKIEKTLSNFNLNLNRKNNCIWIEGKEQNKRELINNLLTKEVEKDFNSLIQYEDYLHGIDTNRIKVITLNSIDSFNCKIKDYYLNSLLSNIYIALYRCRLGMHIEENNSNIIDENSVEFLISKGIYTLYSAHWDFKPTKEDIIYLALLFYGQIIQINSDNSSTKKRKVGDQKFVNIIKSIVSETFLYYKLEIPTFDFIYNFSLHVDALIKRSSSNQKIKNDMLLCIKNNCPFIYDVSVMLSDKISQTFNIKVSDEEIGFIAVHIGFLIENTTSYKDVVNILLLTSEYHQITTTIKEKLTEDFTSSIKIFTEYSNYRKNEIDLIVSNTQINSLGKRLVVVSPFFTIDDRSKVENAIKKILNDKEKAYQEIMLNEFISENLFFKNNELKNKNDAINFLFNKLKEKNVVSDDFYRSMLKRELLSSTCFFNLFALPHSYEFLASKTAFAVLLSEDGIYWDGVKIHLVLMIAIKSSDRTIFMKIYNSIISSLQNKNSFNALIKCNSATELIKVILAE